MSSLDLTGYVRIALLRTFLNVLPVECEVIPVNSTALKMDISASSGNFSFPFRHLDVTTLPDSTNPTTAGA
jgi:hypothetical protein